MSIKAKQTPYKSHLFRSRLEARWAVFFDVLDLQWEYEKEGYELPIGSYLPDFWLPQVNMWAEVKGEKFTWIESTKCKQLATATGYKCLKLSGLPEAKPYLAVDGTEPEDRLPFEPDEWWYALVTTFLDEPSEHRFYSSPEGNESIRWYDDCSHGLYSKAVKAARSARFEFGECGRG